MGSELTRKVLFPLRLLGFANWEQGCEFSCAWIINVAVFQNALQGFAPARRGLNLIRNIIRNHLLQELFFISKKM